MRHLLGILGILAVFVGQVTGSILHPAVDIVEAFDVVLAQIVAGLNFDDPEGVSGEFLLSLQIVLIS